MEDVLDDVTGSLHKTFMTKYLKDWPYPHLTHYIVGQNLNVEFNGVQQRCEVQVIDSSLMQVVFQVSINEHCCSVPVSCVRCSQFNVLLCSHSE